MVLCFRSAFLSHSSWCCSFVVIVLHRKDGCVSISRWLLLLGDCFYDSAIFFHVYTSLHSKEEEEGLLFRAASLCACNLVASRVVFLYTYTFLLAVGFVFCFAGVGLL